MGVTAKVLEGGGKGFNVTGLLDFARKREAEWSGSVLQPHEIDNVRILDCIKPMDSREVHRHWRKGGGGRLFDIIS